jgi:hypothetical protein
MPRVYARGRQSIGKQRAEDNVDQRIVLALLCVVAERMGARQVKILTPNALQPVCPSAMGTDFKEDAERMRAIRFAAV